MARLFLVFLSLFANVFSARAQGFQDPKVGPVKDAQGNVGTVMATGQLIRPAGETIAFHGRPVDIALSPDGKTLFAKDNRGLVVVEVPAWKVKQELPFPSLTGGGSMHGIAVSRDGKRVLVTTSNDFLHVAELRENGNWAFARAINLPGPNVKGMSHPPGIALLAGDKQALVCLSRNNSIAVVDLEGGKVLKTIPVGIAPYSVFTSPDETIAYVSNWGGRHPTKGDRTAVSSESKVVVDDRGIAASGTVGRIDLRKQAMTAEIAVGLHPAGMVLSNDGKRLFVANANSDTVSLIDTPSFKVSHTINVRPVAELPFGSATNALCLSRDGKTLFAANGGNNSVAVLELAEDGPPKITGHIPTGWFPGALATDGNHLFIANVKGTGSRNGDATKGGFNVHRHTGTLSKVTIPDAAKLSQYSRQVIADARIPQILASLESKRPGTKPIPVPKNPGEPSPIEHVVYIIKENRTYDQVFGDFADPKVYPKPKGNGEPKLCIFGREVTPNHHALADKHVLLDNFYCNGVLSADGHSWVTEGNVTDHLEKSFGGFTRSYTYGDDPLTYSSSGFLWDNALLGGRSVRNFGELVNTKVKTKGARFSDIFTDYIKKAGKVQLEHTLEIEPFWQRTCKDYPGWNMDISDQQRVDVFLRELAESEKKGDWANLTFLYLPQDHCSGTAPGMPTPKAHMADNDLALGRAVEAISKSRFWPKTAIFVVEDDPQDGWDHVDGHRSIALVISPYSRKKSVVSRFYNQTSVIHTIEQILGLPPMNQMDALAPLMTECFMETPDLTHYKVIPVTIPLDQLNPERKKLTQKEQKLLDITLRQDFSQPDRINDEEMNRVLWHAVKGVETPYPAEWAGAHGRGLKDLKLKREKGTD